MDCRCDGERSGRGRSEVYSDRWQNSPQIYQIERPGKSAALISARATRQGLTLGQVAVDSHSHEITAIPKLLEMLELRGAMIRIDAMGCQKEIAQQIHRGGCDYVLAVKNYQPILHDSVSSCFLQRYEQDDFREHGCRQHVTTEKARGLVETRTYTAVPLPASMRKFAGDWSGLQSIGQAITHTVTKDGKETSEVRYLTTRQSRTKVESLTVKP